MQGLREFAGIPFDSCRPRFRLWLTACAVWAEALVAVFMPTKPHKPENRPSVKNAKGTMGYGNESAGLTESFLPRQPVSFGQSGTFAVIFDPNPAPPPTPLPTRCAVAPAPTKRAPGRRSAPLLLEAPDARIDRQPQVEPPLAGRSNARAACSPTVKAASRPLASRIQHGRAGGARQGVGHGAAERGHHGREEHPRQQLIGQRGRRPRSGWLRPRVPRGPGQA